LQVATHKDCLQGPTLEEDLASVNALLLEVLQGADFFRRIRMPPEEKDRIFFAVTSDNRYGREDPELEELRTAIDAVVQSLHIVHEPRPVVWLRVLEALQEEGAQGGGVLDGGKAMEVARRAGKEGAFSEDELRISLKFLAHLGELVYFDDLAPNLRDNVVVTDPLVRWSMPRMSFAGAVGLM
jgi:hypothetical protein